ncbi:icarapin-like [Diprion similis]|uniref:icarapin-like n=1 Tax=Diprion similis TaxID=362088 RepID=UPI001EF8B2CA|nr:icarapin-like [Diprion similis]XP_046734273.1 icarapin-like [Diprion similis]XP_046734274.1 icarapin-like [Diprion similis]
MKSAFSLLIFASALFAVAFAYPGARSASPESDEKSEQVLPIIIVPEDLDDCCGSRFFSSFSDNPLDGFLTRMQNMMKTLREQVAASLPGFSNSDDLYDLPKIPEGANTTSTTKVINGHVVTVNETTYSDGDENGSTVLRVRVVDIKPANDEDTEILDTENVATSAPKPANEEPTSPSSSPTDRSVESVEDFSNNEIPERLVAV